MPELPEVESVVRSLKDLIIGQEIKKIDLLREKSLSQGLKFASSKIIGGRIVEVCRRAKFIDMVLIVRDEKLHLVTHLKMTGQLIYVGVRNKKMAGGGHPTNDWLRQLPGKQTRIVYTFNDGSHLYFNDQRVFGWMQVLTDEELNLLYSELGPDVNTGGWTADFLIEKLKTKRIPIKQALLDNKIGCGLGNIYVAEALFMAGIDPRRPSNSLTVREVEKLVEEVKKVIEKAISAGGTTFDGRYVNARGEKGSFVEELNVYGRGGEECVRCKKQLAVIRQGGRQTVFCENCQR